MNERTPPNQGKIYRWDERGPCNGPRDCGGTDRGCAACDPRPTHSLVFEMPGCIKHLVRHRWWCRACGREVERQFRETCHALWELQGAGDRIVR